MENISFDAYFDEQENVDLKKDIEGFKNRVLKANDIFYIKRIDKKTSYEFIRKYHYLGDAKFFCVDAFGLFYKKTNELVGCATYSLPQGNVALKGWFGLSNQTKNIFELSRLCMLPILNGTNATSYLLGGSIKEFQKENNKIKNEFRRLKKQMNSEDWKCRCVITLACSERHTGSIYQVCNFKYYGLSDKKKDFFRYDGVLNPRGETSSVFGVWLPRPQKHRYAFLLDESLEIKYQEQQRPMNTEVFKLDCCDGTKVVYDKRFKHYYTCPRCVGELKRIEM